MVSSYEKFSHKESNSENYYVIVILIIHFIPLTFTKRRKFCYMNFNEHKLWFQIDSAQIKYIANARSRALIPE